MTTEQPGASPALSDQLGRLVDEEMSAYHDAAYADHRSARDQLERFAAAVQAAERERWQKACGAIAGDLRNHDMVRLGAAKCWDAGNRA